MFIEAPQYQAAPMWYVLSVFIIFVQSCLFSEDKDDNLIYILMKGINNNCFDHDKDVNIKRQLMTLPLSLSHLMQLPL